MKIKMSSWLTHIFTKRNSLSQKFEVAADKLSADLAHLSLRLEGFNTRLINKWSNETEENEKNNLEESIEIITKESNTIKDINAKLAGINGVILKNLDALHDSPTITVQTQQAHGKTARQILLEFQTLINTTLNNRPNLSSNIYEETTKNLNTLIQIIERTNLADLVIPREYTGEEIIPKRRKEGTVVDLFPNKD